VQNSTYAIPNSIAIWPGVFPLGSTTKLAPFFDNDNDGIYNPINGDYPLIKVTKQFSQYLMMWAM
jgi:hypothetical protein